MPAFALIKVFSSFFFANHNTKTPFYISLISVALNIAISLYYFKDIGFIIIPVATSISSWFNSIVLFLFLKRKKLFDFNLNFLTKLFKIIFASVLMGFVFHYLISVFENKLLYGNNLKLFYLILSVILGLMFYLIICFLIKAFNSKDLKLKY